jgi:hypothetical protein
MPAPRLPFAVALLIVARAAAPAVARPARHGLTIGGAFMAGSFADTTEGDDTPSGAAPGLSLEIGDYVGRHTAVLFTLFWTTARDGSVDDPFDPPLHDLRITWLEASVAYRRYLGPRGWFGVRLGYGHWWTHEYTSFYGAGTYDHGAAALGLRLGYDSYHPRDGALALVGDLDLMGDGSRFGWGGASAMVGVAYQWQRR